MAAICSVFQVFFTSAAILVVAFPQTTLLLSTWMIDGSITAINGGGIISLWLRLIILDFIEGTHTPLCHRLPVRLTHTHSLQKTFHDIIGFIRSRPKQESGPVADLMSMLSTAEG